MSTVWFILIAGLWTGYFVLEGFDFGVGVLCVLLGRDERERGAILATIGPVWDGNEVWVITAAGATFAVFPDWYASLLSGLYLPLLVILVALIGRGVALEYRGKRTDPTWRRRLEWTAAAGSLLAALLWGLVFGGLLRGLPLSAAHVSHGGLAPVLRPYPLLAALTFAALFLTHGAVFLALKSTGAVRARAGSFVARAVPATLALAVALLGWTLALRHPSGLAVALAAGAALSLAAAGPAAHRRREGWAFIATAAATALLGAALFAALYPRLLPSTVTDSYSLTVHNAAAGRYTLTYMTWTAVAAAPLVLAYQGWTYWVFRRRVS